MRYGRTLALILVLSTSPFTASHATEPLPSAPKNCTAPDYKFRKLPQLAWRGGGIMYLILQVNESGNVVAVDLDKSKGAVVPAVLRDSVVAAVKKWTFKPATCDGKPIKFSLDVPIAFPNS